MLMVSITVSGFRLIRIDTFPYQELGELRVHGRCLSAYRDRNALLVRLFDQMGYSSLIASFLSSK